METAILSPNLKPLVARSRGWRRRCVKRVEAVSRGCRPTATTPHSSDTVITTGPASASRSIKRTSAKEIVSNRTKTGCIPCRKRKEKCDECHPEGNYPLLFSLYYAWVGAALDSPLHLYTRTHCGSSIVRSGRLAVQQLYESRQWRTARRAHEALQADILSPSDSRPYRTYTCSVRIGKNVVYRPM